MPTQPSFTGRRRRSTRWTVVLNDKIARFVIAAGGIGTIVAVSSVAVFLVWVVVPLFVPASVNTAHTLAFAQGKAGQVQLAIGIDDANLTGWRIFKSGTIEVFRLDTGEAIENLSGEESGLNGLTAVSLSIGAPSIAFGFDDGRVRLGALHTTTRLSRPMKCPRSTVI